VITEAEFHALAAQGYNRIPLVLETFADLDTPLSLYLKLAQQRSTFLLESVVGGERFGRYSFIGLPAKIRIRVAGTHAEVEDHGGVIERHEGNPLAFLREFLARFRAHLGLVEKAMGGLLVLTGIAFLTGAVSQASFWLMEAFPVLGRIG